MNEVQEKKDNAVKEEVVFDDITALEKAIEKPENSTLLDEYLKSMQENKEEDFLGKYIKKPEAAADDKSDKKPKGKAKDADEEITIENLKIKSDLLGTYGKNTEDYSEAIVKALTGKKEADKTIKAKEAELETFRVSLQQLSQENEQLRKTNTTTEKKKPAKEEVEVSEVDISKLDEIDFLVEDGQKRAKTLLVELAKANRAQRDKSDALEAELAETKLSIADINKQATHSQKTNDEFTSIDRFVSKHNDVFTTKRSTSEIEQDYLNCVSELGKLAGIKEPMYNKDGSISGKHMAALKEYMEEGSELRTKADEEKVTLPEDFEDLNLVYKIRTIKAEFPNMDYDRALRLYKTEHPDEFTKPAKANGEDVEGKIERGVEKRKEFVKETPLNTGADLNDMAKVNPKTIQLMLEKLPKDRSREEKDLIRKYLISVGMPEAEVDAINQ